MRRLSPLQAGWAILALGLMLGFGWWSATLAHAQPWTDLAQSPIFVDGLEGRATIPLTDTGEAAHVALVLADDSCIEPAPDSVHIEFNGAVIPANRPPVARAGSDQVENAETLITLDGTGSSDPDGDPLAYSWTQVTGTPVSLSEAHIPSPTFTAPMAVAGGETLTFQLVVHDGLATSFDTVAITLKAKAALSTLHVTTFYDANANGINDGAPETLPGWQVRVQGPVDVIRLTPTQIFVPPGEYTVTALPAHESHWVPTTMTSLLVTLSDGAEETRAFGHICLGRGGGHTVGFWTNQNGQALINDGGSVAPELALLSGLNLRNTNGSDFNPTTYAALRTWLRGGGATNMAYMLSTQLAAMALNVEAALVHGASLVYAPALLAWAPAGLNARGFISINALLAAANTELGSHGSTPAGSAFRAYQEALKNALDTANNDQNFVQASPCALTFR